MLKKYFKNFLKKLPQKNNTTRHQKTKKALKPHKYVLFSAFYLER